MTFLIFVFFYVCNFIFCMQVQIKIDLTKITKIRLQKPALSVKRFPNFWRTKTGDVHLIDTNKFDIERQGGIWRDDTGMTTAAVSIIR